MISYIRARIYGRKAIGWNRMSDTIGYRDLTNHLCPSDIIFSVIPTFIIKIYIKTQRIQVADGQFASV